MNDSIAKYHFRLQTAASAALISLRLNTLHTPARNYVSNRCLLVMSGQRVFSCMMFFVFTLLHCEVSEIRLPYWTVKVYGP